MSEMRIVYKHPDELTPYQNNPRNNDDAVPYVAESIKQFGFKVPIIVDSQDVIVAGHTRHKAALKLGLNKVPCIIADDLNDEQIKAFRLADNKVGEIATWNYPMLDFELEEIEEISMDDFGFDNGIEESEETNKDYSGVDFKESYSIIIEFDNEQQQEMAFEKLKREGYKCRISTL